MIVRSLEDVVGTERDVAGPGWKSRRLLLASDGLGFSMTDTIIEKDAVLELEYIHHLEACYCIQGRGQIRRFDEEKWYSLERFTLYALDQNDRHLVQALDADLRLICVFNPPLTGREVHRKDGSYAPDET
ncbi:ectoine synthase [Ruegeria arenilitoris]|uniref:ectoine synthase n=1 Tax=Ruegeria arenilitoris TaxID=1173585 RepID=UPI00147B4F4A|nr:ectoine synthase [Ruegeria arenilitoris]